ncbi:MAG TPA: YlcI/YnfO family protein [Alphaproteobacteria bacterium]
MTKAKTYSLRLPRSLKEAVAELSREEGTSINQFVATAVAEKVSALSTARYFAQRRARADLAAFDRLMGRSAGETPREGDEIAEHGPGRVRNRKVSPGCRRKRS